LVSLQNIIFNRSQNTTKMTSNVVDFEDILNNGFSDANTSIRSGVRARWERKKHESSSSSNNNNSNNDGSSSDSVVSSSTSCLSDRFIPNRAAMDMEKSSHAILSYDGESSSSSFGDKPATTDAAEVSDDEELTMNSVTSDLSEYKSSVLGIDPDANSRILSFADKAPAPKGDTVNNLDVLYSASTTSRKNKSSTKLVSRHIPSAPTRILDAPDLLDDYYLNLLSWSDTNVLAVALSQTVYLWNAETGQIDELCNVEDQGPDAHISSVSWIQEGGGHLAVGTSWVRRLIINL
jgi:cell division cycle 20, cofactor of APC complex